jgi:hypothetical protein
MRGFEPTWRRQNRLMAQKADKSMRRTQIVPRLSLRRNALHDHHRVSSTKGLKTGHCHYTENREPPACTQGGAADAGESQQSLDMTAWLLIAIP